MPAGRRARLPAAAIAIAVSCGCASGIAQTTRTGPPGEHQSDSPPRQTAIEAPFNAAVQARAPSRRAASQRRVQQLRRDLANVFGARLMQRGVWAVDVRSLDTGEQLYELSAGKLVMPASNMKILTLATVAETLGWDYTFTTTLETGGAIANGVLQGDLIVRSNGDPTINGREGRATAVLDSWADSLRAAGITAIDGRIIGDDQAFDDEGIGAGWSWDYLQYGYAAPSGALEFNENVAALSIAPAAAAGEPAIAALTPGTGFTLLNRALTGPAGSEITIDYRRRIDRAVLEVTGSVPAGSAPTTRVVAVVNPTLYFAQSLKDGLVARGIRVGGDAVDLDEAPELEVVPPPVDRRVLVTTMSPPLREIGTVMMKVSQNLYAETLLKALGASQGGPGTAEAGRTAARRILTLWGVPADAFVMYDGSGLSRYNYVTARTITTVLERMYKDPRHKDAFSVTLPIAGKDGSIGSRLKGTRAEGNAIAKTGTIANVRSLSGFIHTRDGEALVFSILTNDFLIPAATVNYMADVAVEVLANFARR